MKRYKLKQDVCVEPLIMGFYASAYLVSPVSAPRMVRKLFQRVLPSFLKSPEVHRRALTLNKLAGSDLVEIDPKQIKKVEEFISRWKSHTEALNCIATDLDQLADLLSRAKGESLDSLRAQIPKSLAPFGDVFYTSSGAAGYRLYEQFVYQSGWYDESMQQIRIFRNHDSTAQSFALSTPRIEDDESLILNIPFRTKALNELYASRELGTEDIDDLAESLGVPAHKRAKFSHFFEIENTGAQSSSKPLREETEQMGTQLRYLGHACVLVKTSSEVLLIDPLLPQTAGERERGERITPANLPRTIDALLITHAHLDHLSIETLLELRSRARRVVVPKAPGGHPVDISLKFLLRELGFTNVLELEAGEELSIGECHVQALPFQGEHGDLDVASRLMFHVETDDIRALFSADARFANPAPLQTIRAAMSCEDAPEKKPLHIFIGMECEGASMQWLYGSLLDRPVTRAHAESRRLNGSDSHRVLKLVETLTPSQLWIYALGQEPWLSHLMKVELNANGPISQEIEAVKENCRRQALPCNLLVGQRRLL